MKRTGLIILFLAMYLLWLASCKKDKGSTVPQPEPKDSLGAGWVKVGQLENLYIADVFFIDNDNGYMVSATKILKSSDGGINWNTIEQPGKTLSNIAVDRNNNACFTNSSGTILYSQNNGLSYSSSSMNGYSLENISDIFFYDIGKCYAVGDKHTWYSIDAGKTWDKSGNSPGQSGYKTVFFVNNTTGWVIARNKLYKTINGGLNWTEQNVSSLVGNEAYGGGIHFINETTGYISLAGSVLKTMDGGLTWQKVFSYTVNPGNDFSDIHFITANEGYFSTLKAIYRTIDGGLSWQKVLLVANSSISEIHFIDMNHGWACGSFGLYKFTQ